MPMQPKEELEMRKKVLAGTREMTKFPMKFQEELLQTLIKDNKDTEYGKKYNFANITNIDAYRKNVPITTYDDYKDYIDKMANEGARNLITSYDILTYNKSSGTSGTAKKLPITTEWFQNMSKYLQYYLLAIENEYFNGEDFLGSKIGLGQNSHTLITTNDGLVWASISDTIAHKYKDFMITDSIYPEQIVFTKPNTNIRYFQTRYSLECKDAVMIDCTYSSFMLDFFRYIEKNHELLCYDIEHGTIDKSISIDSADREILLSNLSPNPKRADELRKIFSDGFNSSLALKIWPNLKLCKGATTGVFKLYTDHIKRKYLGDDIPWIHRGVISSEGLFTVPIKANETPAFLIPDGAYYEFFEEIDGQISTDKVYGLDELEVGKRYEMIITNRSGLYRYRMFDVYEVEGMYNNTPILKILYRSNKTVSLIDECLSEKEIRDAAIITSQELNFEIYNNSLYPNQEKKQLEFYMEVNKIPSNIDTSTIEQALDKNLSNISQKYKKNRVSNICNPCKVHFLQPETNWLWKEVRMAIGTSMAQQKPVTVIETEEQKKFFFKLVEDIDNLR